jgi:hypothetical protein
MGGGEVKDIHPRRFVQFDRAIHCECQRDSFWKDKVEVPPFIVEEGKAVLNPAYEAAPFEQALVMGARMREAVKP